MNKGLEINSKNQSRLIYFFSVQWGAELLFIFGTILLVLIISFELPRPNLLLLLAIISVSIGFILQVSKKRKITRFMSSMRSVINDGMAGNDYQSLEDFDDIPRASILIEDIEKFICTLNTVNSMVGNVSASLAIHANDLSEKTSSVAEKMDEQLTKTDLTHTSVEALAGVFTTALDTAEKTVEVASKSEEEGESGKLVMTQAMSIVTNLSESVVDAGSMIESLASESEEIGGIINVIKGVAEQTNLLALNAAIEAARAGEQGRGFAVVADEVRSLAGKTQQYASEIETIISSLMSRINDVTNKVKESVQLANESDELIESVVVSYSEIVGYMLEVSKLGKQLAEITKHEKNASENVFNMLDEIKLISQSTSEKIGFMQASSAELGGLGQQLGVITNTVSNVETADSAIDLF